MNVYTPVLDAIARDIQRNGYHPPHVYWTSRAVYEELRRDLVARRREDGIPMLSVFLSETGEPAPLVCGIPVATRMD